jgi:hypothetical protein
MKTQKLNQIKGLIYNVTLARKKPKEPERSRKFSTKFGENRESYYIVTFASKTWESGLVRKKNRTD